MEIRQDYKKTNVILYLREGRMVKYHYILIGCIVLMLMLFSLTRGGKALEQDKINYLDEVKAHSLDLNTFEKMSKSNNVIAIGNALKYDSGLPDLKATVRRDKKNVFKSYIDITWKKASATIVVEGRVDNIHWRPKNTSFIYVWDLGDTEDGDFVKCTLNYVSLKYSKGNIFIDNREIGSHEPYTDLAWSSNGEYYVYSVYSSLQIKEFNSGKIWATKTIILDDGKISIQPNTPTQLGYFNWVENDKKILFLWKSHPFDDEPSGYVIMEVGQFKLK